MGIEKYRHTVNMLHSHIHKLIRQLQIDYTPVLNSTEILRSLQYKNLSELNNSLFRSINNQQILHKLLTFLPIIVKDVLPQSASVGCSQHKSTTRQLKKEHHAIRSLLHKSGLLEHGSIGKTHVHCFHTSPGNDQKDSDKNKKNKDDKDKKDEDDSTIWTLLAKTAVWMLTSYMLVASLSLMFPNRKQPEVVRFVSWNEFVHHMLAKGEVEEIIVNPDFDLVTVILHEGAIIKGRRIDHRTFHMNIVDTKKFEEKLRAAEQRLGVNSGSGVPVVYDRGADAAGKILASLIVAGILLSLLWKTKSINFSIKMDSFTQLGRAKFTLVDPLTGQGKGVHFSDVAGLQEAKQEVMEFVDYLKKPERYKSLGAKVPKGALLLGPPGCGKTLLAKAVATESNVPFLSMNGSEFIEMIGGLGAARVRDLFKEGRKRSPCIIYIDEIDAIGRKRSSGSGKMDGAMGEGEQTLNQLLVEMDGMASTEGVMMLASTNRADVLDKALLRPGRFDRHIMIDLPVMEERQQIFEQHLKGISLENSPDTYSKRMAYLTPGFSGADIANVCNEAALHAARGKQTIVKGSDLEYAVERVVGGTEKRSHAMSPAEKKVVAYHESGHALVGWMLEHADALLKVTIVPRTNLALGFAQYTPRDQKLYSKEELFDRMCMALGGRAAEALVFNSITTGAQNDLQKVTKMAQAQVRQLGMNSTVGLLSFDDDKNSIKPYSKSLRALMEHEENRLIGSAYQKTCEVINLNRKKLETLAEALLQKETLNYNDVETLIGPPPHENKRFVESVEFDLPGLKTTPDEIVNEEKPQPSSESEFKERKQT